jgi:hypothetical protein
MACNHDLQAEGRPYPRTCADCGIGPCKKHGNGNSHAAVTPKDLARAILAMNYGALREVADDLARACKVKEVRPKMESAEDFASLLFDWAEASAQ